VVSPPITCRTVPVSALDLFVGQLLEIALAPLMGGVGHEDVELAELLDRLVDQRLAEALFRQIAGDQAALCARLLDLASAGGHRLLRRRLAAGPDPSCSWRNSHAVPGVCKNAADAPNARGRRAGGPFAYQNLQSEPNNW